MVWLPYMAADRSKTTLYLDDAVYRRLKAMARARGMAPAALVREAMAQYVASHDTSRRPRCIGAGASRRGDLSERAEELLEGFGR